MLALLLWPVCAGAGDAVQGEVVVGFDFVRQSGHASNQFAVWIEDLEGNYVKTLYATRYTVNGGYRDRPDSIAVWVERVGLAGMTDVDTITGPTPQTGRLAYAWDLTDSEGEAVPAGTYVFMVEGTLRWKNRVLYAGEIMIGAEGMSAEAEAEFVYEGAQNQPELSGESPENGMISSVNAVYAP